MPPLDQPQPANNLARFGDDGGDNRSAKINYNVSMPGAYSLNRLTPLEIPADQFVAESVTVGTLLTELSVFDSIKDGKITRLDPKKLAALYHKILPGTSRPSASRAAEIGANIVDPNPMPGAEGEMRLENWRLLTRDTFKTLVNRRDIYLEKVADLQSKEIGAAGTATIRIPAAGLGQSIRTVDYDVRSAGRPRLALVETYEFRSFLGDYGVGRTLKTFSLLPGERTTITIDTWRTDAETREMGSSVFDSSDTAAQTRFTTEMTNQSGAAFQDQGGWALSLGLKAEASASFLGIVSGGISFEAGFAANHQEARQSFSSSVVQTGQEHAAQVNNSRRQAVQSTSSSTMETGESTTTVREIANTNLRRVLNFVFRELNQTYETEVILRTIKVAFYNGNPGSAEVVSLADLRKLLNKHVVQAHRENVARTILAMVAECLDHEGNPVTTLQVGTRPNGNVYEWQDAKLRNDGTLDLANNPLGGEYSWRFKPGKHGGGNIRSEGVLTARDKVVLRTDSIIVEALLGQADALDPYAHALQALDLRSREADIEWRKSEIDKTARALNLVDALGQAEKVEAFEKLFGDKPDIQVVPVAAVNNGG